MMLKTRTAYMVIASLGGIDLEWLETQQNDYGTACLPG